MSSSRNRRREGRSEAARTVISRLFLLLAAGFLALSTPAALGHERETPDEVLKQIGVDEHPGGEIPSGVLFTDSSGKQVRLGDYFGKGPVLLTLNYYTCPMLCPLILRNLLSTTEQLRGITLARDFRIVTVSIDPEERPGSARDRADEMHALMKGTPDPDARWPFLYGGREEIRRLTEAVGFRYRKLENEFAHPNVVVVLTAGGKISRYLYGIEQEPRDLKLALLEAADGRIGDSTMANRALLFCFHYDPVEKKYALYARNIMKAGGALTLVFLAGLYLALWKRRKPAA